MKGCYGVEDMYLEHGGERSLRVITWTSLKDRQIGGSLQGV